MPILGGTPVKLNGTLVYGGSVSYFSVSPDGQRVVYSADQEVVGRKELYSVPITGGAATKLSDPSPISEVYVTDIAITPNSLGVVFRSDPDVSGKTELFSNAITGGSLHKLSALTESGMDVLDFAITPNSLGVVYIADQDTDELIELYSNYITGGTPLKLSGATAAGGKVYAFAVTPNSLGVVWMTQMYTGSTFIYELYSNYITGGTPIKLNGPLPPGGSVVSSSTPAKDITPNSQGVVFRADLDTDGVDELYSNSILGGTPVKINGPLVAGGGVFSHLITPNSLGVVYRADQDTDGVDELYSNSILGGTPVKIKRAAGWKWACD